MRRIVRVNRRTYIKPRRCPECGKICIFARSYLSIHCNTCSRVLRHRRKRKAQRLENKRQGLSARGKYGAKYQRARKKLLETHPYCSLCGANECLTVHHVGGGNSNEKLTVLCDSCHQAYEKYNERKERIDEQVCRWLVRLCGGI